MTEAERTDIEARADRCLRRGELAEAISLYESIARAFPDDRQLQHKLTELRESLQPAELFNPKSRFDDRASVPETIEAQAERLVALGDYAGAIAAYRRALKLKPDSELIQDRLAELFRLAQAMPARPAADPKLPDEPRAMLESLLDRIISRRRV